MPQILQIRDLRDTTKISTQNQKDREVEKPFDKEEELTEKTNRLNVLNGLLNVDKRENEAMVTFYIIVLFFRV